MEAEKGRGGKQEPGSRGAGGAAESRTDPGEPGAGGTADPELTGRRADSGEGAGRGERKSGHSRQKSVRPGGTDPPAEGTSGTERGDRRICSGESESPSDRAEGGASERAESSSCQDHRQPAGAGTYGTAVRGTAEAGGKVGLRPVSFQYRQRESCRQRKDHAGDLYPDDLF